MTAWKFVLVLLLLNFVLTQESCDDIDVETSTKKLDGSVIQILFADEEREQIYLVTDERNLYKSSDGGENWEKQMGDLSHSDDTGVQKMYKTSTDGHVLFMGKGGFQYWTTDGSDGNYNYYESENLWINFIPNPNINDSILGIQWVHEGEISYSTLFYSSDSGANWTVLRKYVKAASWSDNGSIYVTSVPEEKQNGSQESKSNNDFILYRMNTEAEILCTSEAGYFDFANDNGVLYVVQEKNNTLHLRISRDRGASFSNTKFYGTVADHPQEITGYSFLGNGEQVSFIHLNVGNSFPYGYLYEANVNDNDFWLSLKNNRGVSSSIDFQDISGLPGIYFANQYNTTILDENQNNDRNIISMFSTNKGATWSPVPVPEDSQCSSPGCSLHLEGPVDGKSILASSDCIGLLLATGNEGTSKESRSDNINLYLSRSGGLSWEKILNGPQIYNWGNFGSLFVSASSTESTSTVSFSWDQGTSWNQCNFTNHEIEVEGVVPIDNSGFKFLVYGTKDTTGTDKGYITFINFEGNNRDNLCVGQNSPGEIDSDFELWNTTYNDECLLGKNTGYSRRKRDSTCTVASAPLSVESANCECTRDDYICDPTCYDSVYDNGEITCVIKPACNVTSADEVCDSNVLVSQGYQLISGDSCSGGVDLNPTNQTCTTSSHSTAVGITGFAIFLLIAFIILTILSICLLFFIFAYKKNPSLNAKLSPFIPDWCTREPGSVEEDNNDLLYSQLGGDDDDSPFDDLFE